MKSRATPDLSRRTFVRQACCAAVGTTGMLSSLAQLRAIAAVAGDSLPSRAAAVSADYKALVCLYLAGGNDGANVLVPSDAASYAAYAKVRGEIAIAQSSLLPIAPKSYTDGRSYGLHPSASELRGLFSAGKLAVLGNVGTLLRPTTLADYQSGRNLPPQLFSHYDQTLQWQSSIPDRPFETGWGGRLADIVDAFNTNNQVSMSITLNGANAFQRGKTVDQFSVSSTGPAGLLTLFPSPYFGERNTGVKAVLGVTQSNLLAAALGRATLDSITDGDLFTSALRGATALKTVFGTTPTAASLAMVAKLISVSQGLGLKRQIFFVRLDGFDLHGAQPAAHSLLLTEISAAMKAFYDATVELGVENQVTTFTASDFGRTFVPNVSGTDHGWGNQQFIMGGAVRGGEIYGQMPSLTVGANDDSGRGRWIPTTSVDEYNATLATWFGVSAANLPVVLPNIGRFAKPNLGFL